MITPTTESPAEYNEGYVTGCVLSDREHRVIVNLPITAWAQLRQWHRDVSSKPLLVRDVFGQQVSIDRSFVAQIERRELDAVVVLESREREQAARRVVDDG